MFLGSPFFPRKGISLLTIAALALLSAGSIAYVVRSLKIAGRAEVEVRQLSRINKENRKAYERKQEAIVALEQAHMQARQRLGELRRPVEQNQRAIDMIEANGEGMICPVDCLLP